LLFVLCSNVKLLIQSVDFCSLFSMFFSLLLSVTQDDREEVRTWVLSVVTDSSIEQRLPAREASRNTLYEGLYASDRPTCIVTGYQIHPADLLEVNNSTANRRDWNAYVVKTRTCPWTGQVQNPLY
jgi:hypothetical protein